MAWPNNDANYSIVGQQATTLKWGTEGLTSTCTVVSADQAEDVEPIYIEQGDGLKATRILLKHGNIWNFTVIDNSALDSDPPLVGETIEVVSMIAGGSTALSVKATIIDNNYRIGRKSEGQRVIRAEIATLVDTNTSNATVII